MVAGNEGRLNQQQFVQCLYLMDQAQRGQAPPPKLPPGPFPPMAAQPQIPTAAQGQPGGFSIADTQRVRACGGGERREGGLLSNRTFAIDCASPRTTLLLAPAPAF